MSNSIQTPNAMPIGSKWIEPDILPLVEALNNLGNVRTFSSCQGHLNKDKIKHPYIAFEADLCQVIALRKKLFKNQDTYYPWQIRSFERPCMGISYVLEIDLNWWIKKNTFWFHYLPILQSWCFKKWNFNYQKLVNDFENITQKVLEIKPMISNKVQGEPWIVEKIKNPTFYIKVTSENPYEISWRALCDMLCVDPMTVQIESHWDAKEHYQFFAFKGISLCQKDLVLNWLKAFDVEINIKDF